MIALKPWQNMRQQVRPQRGNAAEPQASSQQLAAMLRQIDQVACGAENGAGALGDLDPDAGEDRRAWTPFEQFNAEKFLKLADLHRQGGLTDGAFLCCASEVLASGERVEISKLPYRQHDLSLALVLFKRNKIGHTARTTLGRKKNDAIKKKKSA